MPVVTYRVPTISLIQPWPHLTSIIFAHYPPLIQLCKNYLANKLISPQIYLSHAHSCEPIPCENSALAVNQSSARNSEILSQFFKENILEPSLNEVEV